jgi:hypothetical protein
MWCSDEFQKVFSESCDFPVVANKSVGHIAVSRDVRTGVVEEAAVVEVTNSLIAQILLLAESPEGSLISRLKISEHLEVGRGEAVDQMQENQLLVVVLRSSRQSNIQ